MTKQSSPIDNAMANAMAKSQEQGIHEARVFAGQMQSVAAHLISVAPGGTSLVLMAQVNGHTANVVLCDDDRDLAMMGSILLRLASKNAMQEVTTETINTDGGKGPADGNQ